MVEFRLSVLPDDAPNMICCLTDVAVAIDPSSAVHVEKLRSAELVRIFFAGMLLAEQFIMRLGELGIEPDKWVLLSSDPGESEESELPF